MNLQRILIKAEPEPIEIEIERSALIVVDMQNAFVEKGGYLDLLHFDSEKREELVRNCTRLIAFARKRDIKIFYLQMVIEKDLIEATSTAFFKKSRGLSFLKDHPEHIDSFYIEGKWGSEIIKDLKPEKGDIVLKKVTYDGFIGTPLDFFLKGLGINYLFFCGIATNICVETTLRHAFCLGYYPILVSDATINVGEDLTKTATLLNVKSHFGWVTTLEDLESIP